MASKQRSGRARSRPETKYQRTTRRAKLVGRLTPAQRQTIRRYAVRHDVSATALLHWADDYSRFVLLREAAGGDRSVIVGTLETAAIVDRYGPGLGVRGY